MKNLPVILATISLLTGCLSTPDTPVMLTKKDSGKEITLSPGQSMQITLVSNPTTGYDWQFSSDNPAVLRLTESSFKAPESDLCGAPGHSVQKFQAVTPGSGTVTGKYMRHWEKQNPPAEIFQIKVKVKGK